MSKLLGYLVIWWKSRVGTPSWKLSLSKLFGYLVEILRRDPSSVATGYPCPSKLLGYLVIWCVQVAHLKPDSYLYEFAHLFVI